MFLTPFTACISGGTGTGKTEWLKRLIKYKDRLIIEPPPHILYCYSEISPQLIEMKKDNVELYNGVPSKEEILNRPKNTLLILDDLVSEIKSDFLDLLFTRGSHHWNINIILVTQNLFYKQVKVPRINSHYLILLKNPQGLLQTRTLGQQLFPGKLQHFLESYADAVDYPFGYLIINMKPNISEEMRLSTNIFPNEKPLIYLPI